MQNHLIKSIFLFLFSILLTVCATYHHHELINESGQRLVEAQVAYPEFDWAFSHGIVGKRGTSGCMFIGVPVPEKAVISYEVEKTGRSFAVSVIVKKNIPFWFNKRENDICFLILPAGKVFLAFWRKIGNIRMLWIPNEFPEQERQRELNSWLIEYARSGNILSVDKCLKEGADINCRRWGSSLTPLVVSLNNINMLRHLLEKGATIRWELAIASQDGNIDAVHILVEHGADIEARGSYGGQSPLTAATGKGHMEIVRYLVAHGADVNRSIYNGITPIYVAALKRQHEIASFLIENGADVSASLPHMSWTALDIAKQQSDMRMVEILENALMKK